MAGFSSENLQILDAFSNFQRGGFSKIYRQRSRPKSNKLMDLLVYFWLQKWQKMAGFSSENLQILEGFWFFWGGKDNSRKSERPFILKRSRESDHGPNLKNNFCQNKKIYGQFVGPNSRESDHDPNLKNTRPFTLAWFTFIWFLNFTIPKIAHNSLK